MTRDNLLPLTDDGTLDQQIRRIEQRMMRRRLSSRAHLTRFRWQLRENITSPVVLLVAGGVGFAISATTGSKPEAQSSSTAAAFSTDGVRLLSTLVTMVSLTGSVMTLWQRFTAPS